MRLNCCRMETKQDFIIETIANIFSTSIVDFADLVCFGDKNIKMLFTYCFIH